ncbi:MAG: hypothetical protein ACRDDY_17070 [Clostridium sp.]|uniref:hypothetical protein n=1 Tax=Clostridium sp. TaxID=1506 RepID=UPI003EE6E988
MIKVGDKIRLIKPINMLTDRYIGTEFEITMICGEHVYFKAPIGAGGMTMCELNRHFVKVPEPIKVNKELTLRQQAKLILEKRKQRNRNRNKRIIGFTNR